ncbi:MAG TPA: GspE/PulE family protein [Gemmatimonadales bacterium]|nr:GspE/PulE family protein [Gemmatimonadales bacterium]
MHSQLSLRDFFEACYLEYNRILPLETTETHVRVAVCGDPDPDVLAELEREFGRPVELVPVSDEELSDGIRRAYAAAESMVEVVKDLRADEAISGIDDRELADARDLASQPPVVKYVNLLIKEAHDARASDIHLESTPQGLRARLRIDGVLADAPAPPPQAQAAIVSRVKLLAELDIAERRAPQDGSFRIRLEARELDIRVSTVPTLYGESVVLRLLDRGGKPVSLDELGMAPATLKQFRALVARPTGIVIAAGPTGSGKTTTLYSALALRDTTAEKVITVEDPVEYHLAGVTQIAVNRKAGMTFASALRSVLRQDPDVMMVGEMRDPETAEVAVQAAMTGHLVFSTLHTNDAPSAVTRLLDLQVAPYQIAATVNGVLSQRLVRRICPDCREHYRPDPQVVAFLASEPVGKPQLTRGRGCDACRGTGYRGRIGIFELVIVSETINRAISAREPLARIRDLAEKEGMRSLKRDGWVKVQAEITTVEEVLRVTAH